MRVLLRALRKFSLLACVAAMAGCGASRPPLPPSLELPQPVRDLRAVRKGNHVYLTWSVPTRTTDLQAVRRLGSTRICRSLQGPATQCVPVGEVPTSQIALPKPTKQRGAPRKEERPNIIEASYTDALSPDFEQQNPTTLASYAVETLNSDGHGAGLSNQVQVPLARILPAPGDVRAEVTAQGIAMSWTASPMPREFPGVSYLYRLYRREKGSRTETVAGEVPLGSTEQATLLDHTFEWQTTYEYRVTAVTAIAPPGQAPAQVEGDDSPSISVVANDIFPPAVPSGLQAVFSGVGQQPFIDLTWSPDTDADLAGYNVYRREEGTQFAKINTDLVKTPTFRDNAVELGKQYFYAVSAVDLRGNESARSEESSESVPMRNSRLMEVQGPVRRAQTYLPQGATRTSSARDRTT